MKFLLAFMIGIALGSPAEDRRSIAAFRECLAEAGVNVDLRFFEYDPDPLAPYASFNYQWELISPTRSPGAYFLIETAADVQTAVRCGKALGVPLVPKGGGHSYEKYSYTHAPGQGAERAMVVLDMQRLDSVTVDRLSAQFTVGAGALLAHVGWPLYDVYRLTTPHGTCPTVGIAGLALGGGYGYLSRMYGLSTDAVVELELVDAEGELRTVNKETDPDLFWALKGAGPASFGVVTKLTMTTHEPPKLIVMGTVTYPQEAFAQVFSAWQRFLLKATPKQISSKFAVNNGSVVVEIFEVQIEEGEGGWGEARIRLYLQDFPVTAQLQFHQYNYMDFLMKTMHSKAYGVTHPSQFPSLTRLSNPPKRFKAKSWFVERAVGEGEVAVLAWALDSIPSPQDIIIELYQFGGAINDPDKVAESSFVHREGILYLAQAFYEWRPPTEPRADAPRDVEVEQNLAWLREYFTLSTSLTGAVTSYQNYADADLADYLHRYYGNALPRLMEVKRVVDPSNYFRGPQTIPL